MSGGTVSRVDFSNAREIDDISIGSYTSRDATSDIGMSKR
jgi:hypothetical protein